VRLQLLHGSEERFAREGIMTPLPWWVELYDTLFPVIATMVGLITLTLAGFLIAEGVKLAAEVREWFE
jgi:hypothetical protein